MSSYQQYASPGGGLGLGGRVTWAVQRLILWTGAAYAAYLVALPLDALIVKSQGFDLLEHLAFTPGAFVRGELWQPVTYLFLHGGLMHLAVNMLTLFFFGPDVEREIGTPQFFRMYFFCGVISVLATLLPFILNGHNPGVVGASGAVMGILVGFVMIDPQRQVFLFPFPVPITAFWMMIFIVGINIISSLQGSGISVETHFGGMAAGYVYMKYLPRLERAWRLRKFRVIPKPKPAPKDTGNPDFDKLGKVVNDILKDKERDFHDRD